MAYSYVKRAGAPAGLISLDIGGNTYVINDTGAPRIVVTDPEMAAELAVHPYLQLEGGSGTYTPPPVIQDVLSVDGVLSVPGPNETYIALPINASVQDNQAVVGQLTLTSGPVAVTGTFRPQFGVYSSGPYAGALYYESDPAVGVAAGDIPCVLKVNDAGQIIAVSVQGAFQ